MRASDALPSARPVAYSAAEMIPSAVSVGEGADPAVVGLSLAWWAIVAAFVALGTRRGRVTLERGPAA